MRHDMLLGPWRRIAHLASAPWRCYPRPLLLLLLLRLGLRLRLTLNADRGEASRRLCKLFDEKHVAA
jgi:hypothetical protein